ncbi:MAG TPA: CDP-alcohol phosphatidyltransferase family protein [Actinomycetota bacterium]|nr:CDP-alcohol phosphatidyltransferase family protein [Actinomycetota bacterium]
MTTDDRKQPREAHRVRDMPAPRKGEGAAGGAAQRIFAWPYRGILAFLLWTGIRAWQLTLLSLFMSVVCGLLILAGSWAWAGGALIAAGTFDVMDGSVARHRGEVRRSGAFMDSVLDRVSDMILFSCLFWYLAGAGEELAAMLALITLVVSLAVSHVRAEAEAAKVVLTEGLFQRLERMIALAVGLLIPGMMLPVLVLLAVLGTATALQRSFLAVRGA